MEVIVFYLLMPKNISIQSKKLWKKTISNVLGNILKQITTNNIENTRFNGYGYGLFVDYNIIDTRTWPLFINIWRKKWYEIMFGFIKKMFIGWLMSTVNIH